MKHKPSKLAQFFHLILLYWRSKDKSVKASIFYFLLSVALVVFVVVTNVLLNTLSGRLFNSIQDYYLRGILHAILSMLVLFVLFAIFSAYQGYFFALMRIRWRNWLTHYFISRWLNSRAYYQIETFGSAVDNADQRISDDIAQIINISSDLLLGLLNAVLSMVSFAVILWSLSTPLLIPLGHNHHFTLHGDMLWFALLYSIVTTVITFKIGRPLINLSFMQQRFEAFFRFNLMRIREHSEQIALYQAETFEKEHLQTRFNDVIVNFISIARRERLLALFTGLIGYLANFVPTLLALPGYFARKYQMGGISQITQAFSVVSNALNFFISNYTSIASIAATSARLQLLMDQSEPDGQHFEDKPYAKLQLEYIKAPEIMLKHLTAYKPDGSLLFSDLNETFKQGEHTLIMGPSGVGKSTLLRIICGIWPFAEGCLQKPQSTIWFIPQKPYLPEGSIIELMSFPDPGLCVPAKIEAALGAVGLAALLHNPAPVNWSHALSLGEQQRLAFARVLLHRPDWLLVDEATSHLDEANEALVYRLIHQELPHTTIISVGHRSTLKALHRKTIVLAGAQV